MLLRNLLPNNQYSLEKPDTVALAELSLESLDKLSWLGGSGYDLLALYIPGVVHKSADGTLVKGKYCPTMFENLADPILTGREELGVPKMFSDIAISRTDSSCAANISWRGAQWAELKWSNLQKPGDATVLDQPNGGGGLLLHKYIPATGRGKLAEPDADDAVFIGDQPDMSSLLSSSVVPAADVTLKITDLGRNHSTVFESAPSSCQLLFPFLDCYLQYREGNTEARNHLPTGTGRGPRANSLLPYDVLIISFPICGRILPAEEPATDHPLIQRRSSPVGC